jgi:hypothetical protein
MWIDDDGELFDVVCSFGLEADGAEGFGEGGVAEVEIFDDGLISQ